MKIEKLENIITTNAVYAECEIPPTNEMLMVKINELCEAFNALEEKERGCQCDACKQCREFNYPLHKSDCAVHNEPAERNGNCTCEVVKPSWEEELESMAKSYPNLDVSEFVYLNQAKDFIRKLLNERK